MMVTTGVATEADITGGAVAGHDGSAASGEAVRWAARAAPRLGLVLHVVRAWNIVTAPRPDSWETGYVPPLVDFESAVRLALEADVGRLALPEDCEVVLHVLYGPATRILLDAAEHADLLVVGSRGAGGFRGMVFGSTADQVLRHASCPVVVVPADAAAQTPSA